jgi:PAS domain S-box-containing protein
VETDTATSSLRSRDNATELDPYWSPLLDAVDCILLLLDPQGRVQRANAGVEAALGVDSTDLVGLPFWDLLGSADGAAELEEEIRALVDKGGRYHGVLEMRAADVTPRVVVWTVRPLPRHTPEAPALIATGFDTRSVSRRPPQRVERPLDHGDIVANIPGAVFQLVVEKDGSLTAPLLESGAMRSPDSAERIERAAASPMRFIADEDRDRLARAIHAAARAMRPVEADFRSRALDGSLKSYHCSATPHRLPDGRVAFSGVALDVTHLRQTEEALQESRRALASLLSNLPGIAYHCRHDDHRTVVLASDGAVDLLGCTPEQLIAPGEPSLGSLTHPEDLPRVRSEIDEAVEARRPFQLEYRIRHADGHYKWVWDQGRGVYANDGSLVALGGFLGDITEKRLLEEEVQRAQRLESIGLLAGGIAHDFNNVLMGVLGNIAIARQEIDEDSPSHLVLRSAEAACVQARQLTDQLLTFARGGAPMRDVIDIGALIEDTVTLCTRGSNARAVIELADGLWPADADPTQIAQAVQNVTINAVQSMPAGGTVAVRANNARLDERIESFGSHVRPGDYVRIAVSDQGRGIRADQMQKIFDPFFTTKEEGTGLGLATTYSIVRRHGGGIFVNSTPGVGTTFELYLPAVPQAVKSRAAPDHRAVPAGTATRRVLVLDDNDLVRNVLQAMLDHMGLEADACAGGDEAVELCRAALAADRRYDLAVLDLTIPGEAGGFAVLERLRALDPDIRAVVSSGYADDPILSQYEKHGFQGALVKPYSNERLAAVVQSVLGSD